MGRHLYIIQHSKSPYVTKCHGYDGYIRVEILASWGKSLGEHIIWQNQAFFGEDSRTCVRLPYIN